MQRLTTISYKQIFVMIILLRGHFLDSQSCFSKSQGQEMEMDLGLVKGEI